MSKRGRKSYSDAAFRPQRFATSQVRIRVPSEPFLKQKQWLLRLQQEQLEMPESVLHELVALHEQYCQPQKARKYLRRLIGLDSSLSAKAAAFGSVGGLLLNGKHYLLAEKYLRVALLLEKRMGKATAWTHLSLGGCYNGLGNYLRAERCCRRAIQIDSTVSQWHKTLGAALVGQGRYREAAQVYVTAKNCNYELCQALGELLERQRELRMEFGGNQERMYREWHLSMQARPCVVYGGFKGWRRSINNLLRLLRIPYLVR